MLESFQQHFFTLKTQFCKLGKKYLKHFPVNKNLLKGTTIASVLL